MIILWGRWRGMTSDLVHMVIPSALPGPARSPSVSLTLGPGVCLPLTKAPTAPASVPKSWRFGGKEMLMWVQVHPRGFQLAPAGSSYPCSLSLHIHLFFPTTCPMDCKPSTE